MQCPEGHVARVQMVLKCADIGHLAAAARTHKRWAYQLEEEFFRQGDKERARGLPVSPLMDRSTQGGMTRSQVGRPLWLGNVILFLSVLVNKATARGLCSHVVIWRTVITTSY